LGGPPNDGKERAVIGFLKKNKAAERRPMRGNGWKKREKENSCKKKPENL